MGGGGHCNLVALMTPPLQDYHYKPVIQDRLHYVIVVVIMELLFTRGGRFDPSGGNEKVVKFTSLVDINLDGSARLRSFETAIFEIFADKSVLDAEIEPRIEPQDGAQMSFLFAK